MVRKRSKPEPYVRRQGLAFRVFGEIRPIHTRFILRMWIYEDDTPFEVICDSLEIAHREKEKLILRDMEALEEYVDCQASPDWC